MHVADAIKVFDAAYPLADGEGLGDEMLSELSETFAEHADLFAQLASQAAYRSKDEPLLNQEVYKQRHQRHLELRAEYAKQRTVQQELIARGLREVFLLPKGMIPW